MGGRLRVGECLPQHNNYAEVDKEKLDAWGIPTLKVSADWSDNEKKLWDDARVEAAQMLEAAGAKNVRLTGEHSVPGFCIHETGTARMSNDPKKGVLNRYAQAHDIPMDAVVTEQRCTLPPDGGQYDTGS